MQENQRLKIELEGKNYIWEIPGYDQYQISSHSRRTRRGNNESYTKDKLSSIMDSHPTSTTGNKERLMGEFVCWQWSLRQILQFFRVR